MNSKKLLKGILFMLIIAFFLIVFPNTVNAAVEYTRAIAGNDGSITLNLTGLELDENKAYSFALVTKGGTPTTWHTLTEYTENTAQIPLSSATTDIVNVLKVTDTGVLYVKNNSDDSYVVNAMQVNLKLPYLQFGKYEYKGSENYNYYYIYNLYSSLKAQNVQIQKVTDKNLVQKYLNVKNNNSSITLLENSLPNVPSTGYSSPDVNFSSWTQVTTTKKNDGLYLIWVKLSGDNCKDVYGCIIHDGLPEATKVEQYIEGLDVEAPTVKSIQVISPVSGTYKTPQTVKIAVYFSETIKGSTIPTLTVKFGDSEERKLTNGTIKNTGYTTPCIEYTYNIQDSDKGQLQTVSLAGGNITDEAGNNAKLSCPVLTGSYTIKANVEGTTTNNTDNQDKKNNETTNNGTTTTNNNSSTVVTNNNDNVAETKNNSTTTGANNNKATTTTDTKNTNTKDTTIMPGTKLPQAGESYVIIALISVVLIAGVVLYIKYSKMKDIK